LQPPRNSQVYLFQFFFNPNFSRVQTGHELASTTIFLLSEPTQIIHTHSDDWPSPPEKPTLSHRQSHPLSPFLYLHPNATHLSFICILTPHRLFTAASRSVRCLMATAWPSLCTTSSSAVRWLSSLLLLLSVLILPSLFIYFPLCY
jgi:hypothetical protein